MTRCLIAGCTGELREGLDGGISCSVCQRAFSSERLLSEIDRLRTLINTPTILDFQQGVRLEAAQQQERWGTAHDAGKDPSAWFWLLGHLAGKALAAAVKGDTEKALHHCISSAAALLNWHAHLTGARTGMRPGISPPEDVR